jgi:Na+-transporting NADH:ubiquinone oxidoreductase subunit NqrD
MFSASEACCWLSSPFLVLSELWQVGSTQLFCLEVLSKLTHSIWLHPQPLTFDVLGPMLTLAVCSIFLFYYFMWVHGSCFQTHQKRASDSITDGCEPPCGCWDLNSGPLEEQSVLLTAAEPSLQPLAICSNLAFSRSLAFCFHLCLSCSLFSLSL